MRVFTLSLVVILISVATAKGKWKHKKRELKQHNLDAKFNKGWKAEKSVYSDADQFASSEDKDMNMIGNPKEYGEETNAKTYKLNHYFGKKVFKKKKYGGKRYKKVKKGMKMHHAMEWLNIQSDAECKNMCKEGEVCVAGPMVTENICVHKKDLKKSMKLFHKYHKNKKEAKKWNKFQKKHYRDERKYRKKLYKKGKFGKKFNKKEKYGKKFDKAEKYGKKLDKEEKYGKKFDKEEKYGKKVDREEKYGKKFSKEEKYGKKFSKEEKYGKKFHKGKKYVKDIHHQKEKVMDYIRQTFGKPGADCSGSNMVQMKNRLMGWFHLLHGQDREARKAHGGSIAKFYKHVSVKKELRKVNGEECQCFKSAIWQFHQLDKSKDNNLTQEELAYLQDNSVEPCLKPYLKSCDQDGDSKISNDEWCCCFAHVLPPCFKEFSKIKKAAQPVTYLPRCDKEGYYLLEQCKGDKADDSYECWCVDFNGNQYKDTLKKGRAHCHKIEKLSYERKLPLM